MKTWQFLFGTLLCWPWYQTWCHEKSYAVVTQYFSSHELRVNRYYSLTERKPIISTVYKYTLNGRLWAGFVEEVWESRALFSQAPGSDSADATNPTASCHCKPNSIATITRRRLRTCQLQAQAPPTQLQAPGSDNAETTDPHILALMLRQRIRAIGPIRTRKWK